MVTFTDLPLVIKLKIMETTVGSMEIYYKSQSLLKRFVEHPERWDLIKIKKCNNDYMHQEFSSTIRLHGCIKCSHIEISELAKRIASLCERVKVWGFF